MRKLFITIFLASWFVINMSSCVNNDHLEDNFIYVAGDTIYDPIVYAEEKVFCYGGYRFKVNVEGIMPDGNKVSFVLIADDLDESMELGIHEYNINTINSECGEGGVVSPWGNIVQGGFSDIGETFSLVGSVGMECKKLDGSWSPIDSDLYINLTNIKNPKN